MTYATQQNMIDRYGEQELIELTDRAQLGVIDATALAGALVDADAEINAYLVSRYSLPLASVPPVLTRFASDIARYMLYDTRAPEQVKDRYDAAIKFFKLIADGKASLGLDPVSLPVADVGGVQVSAPDRVFNSSAFDGF